MIVNAGCISHVGRVRDNNEDNFFFVDRLLKSPSESGKVFKAKKKLGKPVYLCVFDGMGGMSAGEQASLIASNTAAELTSDALADPEITLMDICDKANTRICRDMRRRGVRMGTTAAMLALKGESFSICNIGDSPVYMLRDGALARLSKEHTTRGDPGQADPKAKFKLTQYLGIFPEEAVIAPYLVSGELMPGDRFLICSDGLTDALSAAQIRDILSQDMVMKQTARELVEAALDGGSRDNVTVICAEISD